MTIRSQREKSAVATADPEGLAPHAPLTGFYRTPDARAAFVNALFDSTAAYYDNVSLLLAFGSDRRYRRQALLKAGLRRGLKVLDVATGTGLVLAAALELGLPAEDLVGLDPSRGMLQENRKQRAVALVQGRGERLPFAKAAFDFVTMGYALRHVEDLHGFFSEVRRVLKPRGRILILEIARPQSPLLRGLMRWHLLKVVPCLARLQTGRRETARLMEYYWATIEGCVPPAAILTALAAAGFQQAHRQTWGGILSDYSAVNGEA